MESVGVKTKRPAEGKRELLEIDFTKKAKFEERHLKIVDNKKPNAKKASMPPDIKDLGRSLVLNKVKNFLPEISRANLELRKEFAEGRGEKFNLENIEDSDRIIEMDLSFVPGGCTDVNIPPPIRDLFDNLDENSDSESSDDSDEKNEEKKKKLIEEVDLSGNEEAERH